MFVLAGSGSASQVRRWLQLEDKLWANGDLVWEDHSVMAPNGAKMVPNLVLQTSKGTVDIDKQWFDE